MQSLIQKEGKAHNNDTVKADKIVSKKKPEKTEEKPKDAFEGKINKYGFLHFGKELYDALGWAKGEDIAVKITKTANGIAVEKA